MRWIRSLYDWVLSWAESPYAVAALAVLAFTESSFFPIAPDVLLIALCIGDRKKALWFATVCAVASCLGGAFGYLIGWGVWSVVDQFFFRYVPGFTEEVFQQVQDYYEKWNFVIVFAASFTPIPYKVFTIGAGVCRINFVVFMIASLVGRSARFFIVATLFYFFGESIRGFIDRWFNLLVILFTFLLIGGFVVIKYLPH